ncbi:MAG: HD domain-containing phosphohydrolase [Planctomycetota bacterium]
MTSVIKKRHILIVLIATAQAICLLFGTLAFYWSLQGSMRETIHEQVLADNIQAARQMTTLIRQMGVSDLRNDKEAWAKLQSVIHKIELPNDGFVCVTDADDGSLLCHPALGDGISSLKGLELVEDGSENEIVGSTSDAANPRMTKPEMTKPEMVKPELAKPAMVKPEMIKPEMAKSGMIKPAMVKPEMPKPEMTKPAMQKGEDLPNAASEPALVTGAVKEYDGELQIIAAASMPEINASVNVHQLASGIDKKINRTLAKVLPIGALVSALLLVCTTLVVLAIMRLYDNRLAAINEQLEQLVSKRTRSLRKVRDAVIFGLAKLAESRDTDTGEHLERIGLYVSVLAAEFARTRTEIDTRYIENLALASSLHDIGKVGIPDAVLLKPGRFEPDERKIMEKHSELGGECLKAIGDQLGEDDFLQLSREIAYCHHEKWDGSGYPFGVAGEAIPFSARIVALADVYDALRSRRPYKDPMSHEKAKQIILDGRGSHFDPQVVDAFESSEARFVQISEQYNTVPTPSPLDHSVESEEGAKIEALAGV